MKYLIILFLLTGCNMGVTPQYDGNYCKMIDRAHGNIFECNFPNGDRCYHVDGNGIACKFKEGK